MEETQTQIPEEAAVQAPTEVLEVQPEPGVLPEEVRDAMMLANARIRKGLERHIDLCYRAFRRGSAASFGKFSRTSTEYGDPALDDFFYAGYDGESWEQAVKRLIV
jgi:hypothetical protein